MTLAVGIDLGTTNSLVAWLRDGRPEIIPNRAGSRLTPSVVGLDPRGNVHVGATARAQLTTYPERTVAEVKRLMGSEATVALGGQSCTPTEVSALILRALVEDAVRHLGRPIREAVITVPAYFTDSQRQATKDAGELAGLEVERIINEPTAAALAYGLDRLDAEELVVVYDLGGGTLDVSVLEMFEGVLEVKASAGNTRLGGSDFDQALAGWLRAEFERTSGVSLGEDRRALARLKQAAEQAKVELTTLAAVGVSLPYLAAKDGVPLGLEVEVTRERLDALTAALVEATLEPLRQALADAQADARRVSQVVLVGGASRMPLVRRRVAEFFGKEPLDGVHPDEAIALGAAVQAGLKTGAISAATGILITDVSPFTLGVEVASRAGAQLVDGLFSPIIPRNSTIPCSRTETYSTTADGQRQVEIKVYQGEARLVRNNVFLDQYTVDAIPPGPAGSQQVAVTFTYDINGILKVSTRVVATGKEATLVVDRSPRRMSEEERSAVKERLASGWPAADVASAPGGAPDLPDLGALLAVARARLGGLGGPPRDRLARLLADADGALARADRTALVRLDVELTDLLFELDG